MIAVPPPPGLERPPGRRLEQPLRDQREGPGRFETVLSRKNPVKTPHKLAFVKYDPVVRRRVLFTEKKMPSGKKR